jgi:hypothetical protein
MSCPKCKHPLTKVINGQTRKKPYRFLFECMKCKTRYEQRMCINCGSFTDRKSVCEYCLDTRIEKNLKARRERLCLQKSGGSLSL